MSYDPTLILDLAETVLTFENDNLYWIYVVVAVTVDEETGVQTESATIEASESHIDPMQFWESDGKIYYKFGWFDPVIDGKREAYLLWGNAKSQQTTKQQRQSASALHIEAGRLTPISDRSIEVVFNEPFNNIPVGWVKVYRMQSDAGKWLRWDVLHYFTSSGWLTNTGFALQIDLDEELSGIIVEWEFKEVAPINIEFGRITNLTSRLVAIEFTVPFTELPAAYIKVYRTKSEESKWFRWDVLYFHPAEKWLTLSGFTLQIEDNEPLEGIVIEYEFKS